MSLLDAFKIKKSLAVLLASQNLTSPQTVQALSKLKAIGRPALAKFVEVLGSARNPASLEALLAHFLDNETFPFFVHHLAHPNFHVLTSMVHVFVKSTKYDPNRLLILFADAKIPKAALREILTQRKDHLHVKSLIALLGTADRESRDVLLRLIEQLATESMLLDLIWATRSEDHAIRTNMAHILARFGTDAVRETLIDLLNDPHQEVRHAALDGLSSLKTPLDIGPICQLLRDPDPAIHSKSKALLMQAHDPQTMHYLVDLLQDDAEDVQQRAVDVVHSVWDGTPTRVLLGALRDKEWWVKERIFNVLRFSGEWKPFDDVLTLLKDEDEDIRRGAVEILTQDQWAFNSLIGMLDDHDGNVRVRTVEALVTLQDKRTVPVFLRVLHETPEVGSLVIPALANLGDHEAIPPLVECLQGTNQTLCKEALRALATLTDAAHAEQVLQAVMTVRDTADTELKEVANDTAAVLIGKFGVATVGGNKRLVNIKPMVGHYQSLLLDVCSPGAEGRLGSDAHTLGTMVTEAPGTTRYIDPELLAPDDLLAARYRVIRSVGKGGFGSVILVEDTAIGEEIILKFLNPQVALKESMIKRFVYELRYARRISHENVIRIHDFLMLEKSYAISMEYFSSHSLGDEIQRGPLGIKRGLKIIWDVCCGMSAAHKVGVIHRDLKPPNILINNSCMVKVVDFGLAVVNDADSRLTKTGILLGTPTYMAPEQVRARTIDARTDIYSLGVLMYQMFTGSPPYVSDDPMAVLSQHVEGNPTPPQQLKPNIPQGLENIILKAMSVDPAKRFQTVDDLRRSILTLSKQKVR